jgi:hypothetical protein
MIFRILTSLILIFCVSIVFGQQWTNRLQDGSRIYVDPNTNKATIINKQGLATPLWDGVHRLQDGSSITVRDGVMVPNADVLKLRRTFPPQGSSFVEGLSPCVELQRKVCGLYEECADHHACAQAKQLVQFEKDEERERKTGAAFSFREMPDKCRLALQDTDMFASCPEKRMGSKPTPCEELVIKVCGTRNQCAQQPACAPAKQLMDREYQERITALSSNSPTYTTGQCRTALGDKQFFIPCK